MRGGISARVVDSLGTPRFEGSARFSSAAKSVRFSDEIEMKDLAF